MDFGDSEFITIMATSSANMAAFSKFPYRSIDTLAIIQGIVFVWSASDH